MPIQSSEHPTFYRKPSNMSNEAWRSLWAIPDWKNANAYPKGLSRPQIKWEFIRRNSDYRSLWESYQNNEEYGSSIFSSADDDISIQASLAANEFHLKYLLSPSLQAIDFPKKALLPEYREEHLIKFKADKDFIISLNSKELENLICDDRFAVIAFDLRFPLAQQLSRVSHKIKTLQKNLKQKLGKKAVRGHDKITQNYITHLRVLDAYSERCKPADIGKNLFIKVEPYQVAGRAKREFDKALDMWRRF